MARREPHWVKLFLRELECTGNVRLAAEGAGVDFSTAYQRRKRHAEFAEAWERALRLHASRSAQDERGGGRALVLPPPSAAPSLSPEGRGDLVLRPDGKVVKGSDARWGKRAEEAFLTELTVSGNVRRAAEAAGFSTTAAYKRRLKSRHFTAAWDAAIETGKARVQGYLVEAATRAFDPDELPIGDERELPKVSISEAINIAKLKGPGNGPAAGFSTGGRGFEGRTYDETGFDTTPITREEWEEAGRNVVDRLTRLRENIEKKEKETGRCHCCGQELPSLTEGEISA